jgi:hypothetical protein
MYLFAGQERKGESACLCLFQVRLQAADPVDARREHSQTAQKSLSWNE